MCALGQPTRKRIERRRLPAGVEVGGHQAGSRSAGHRGDGVGAMPLDPRRPEVIADPFPVFQELREQAPLYRSSVLGGWVLTRYDDVKLAISDRPGKVTRKPRLRREELLPFSAPVLSWTESPVWIGQSGDARRGPEGGDPGAGRLGRSEPVGRA